MYDSITIRVLKNSFYPLTEHTHVPMLTRKVTPELVTTWKETAKTFRPLLQANKKTGPEILAYLTGKYPVREFTTDTLRDVVEDNILSNECHARKMPAGKTPEVYGFVIENTGTGKHLYETQDELFRGRAIIGGVELHSGYFMVEGSSLLWDELCAFRGLDEDDLENFYMVAEYVGCLRRFDLLESVLGRNAP